MRSVGYGAPRTQLIFLVNASITPCGVIESQARPLPLVNAISKCDDAFSADHIEGVQRTPCTNHEHVDSTYCGYQS